MSIAPDRYPEPGPPRPVDRALVHRAHPEETFLAGAWRTGPHGFTAAALLPPAHPHYGAHTGPSRGRDPLLLLECCRQAETYLAHTVFDVDRDTKFVLHRWSATFADPPNGPPTGAVELVVDGRTYGRRMMRDRLRSMGYAFTTSVAGRPVGRVEMEVGYVGAPAYAVLRARGRGGPPPRSDELAPTPGRPVEPARVGRLRATDTVLRDLDVDATTGSVAARLRVPAENPSLFDHAQDHVPAMVLTEAARQLAVVTCAERGGPGPDRAVLRALEGTFTAYAELDAELELTAAPARPGAAGSGTPVEVVVRQSGTEVSRIVVVVAEPGEGRPWPGRRS